MRPNDDTISEIVPCPIPQAVRLDDLPPPQNSPRDSNEGDAHGPAATASDAETARAAAPAIQSPTAASEGAAGAPLEEHSESGPRNLSGAFESEHELKPAAADAAAASAAAARARSASANSGPPARQSVSGGGLPSQLSRHASTDPSVRIPRLSLASASGSDAGSVAGGRSPATRSTGRRSSVAAGEADFGRSDSQQPAPVKPPVGRSESADPAQPRGVGPGGAGTVAAQPALRQQPLKRASGGAAPQGQSADAHKPVARTTGATRPAPGSGAPGTADAPKAGGLGTRGPAGGSKQPSSKPDPPARPSTGAAVSPQLTIAELKAADDAALAGIPFRAAPLAAPAPTGAPASAATASANSARSGPGGVAAKSPLPASRPRSATATAVAGLGKASPGAPGPSASPVGGVAAVSSAAAAAAAAAAGRVRPVRSDQPADPSAELAPAPTATALASTGGTAARKLVAGARPAGTLARQSADSALGGSADRTAKSGVAPRAAVSAPRRAGAPPSQTGAGAAAKAEEHSSSHAAAPASSGVAPQRTGAAASRPGAAGKGAASASGSAPLVASSTPSSGEDRSIHSFFSIERRTDYELKRSMLQTQILINIMTPRPFLLLFAIVLPLSIERWALASCRSRRQTYL